MFHRYTIPILAAANEAATLQNQKAMYNHLRELPFSDFCQAMMSIPPEFDSLAKNIPRLPPKEIQEGWTGFSGDPLMLKSCSIVRLFQNTKLRITGSDLGGRILDYGCGWGRLLRLVHYFTDPEFIYGVDPMESSLELCRNYGLASHLALCDSIPTSLPFEDTKFDFVFSYSVLTHTSEESTRAILRVVRNCIESSGVFVVTIRPEEFWNIRRTSLGNDKVNTLIAQHNQNGYAFVPMFLNGKPSSTYGETSISFDYFKILALEEGWRVAYFDCDFQEPFQIMVSLVPN